MVLGKWVQVDAPGGKKLWKQRKDNVAAEAPAATPENVDVAVDSLAVDPASFSSTSTIKDEEPEFASPVCVECCHKFKINIGREQSRFCRRCGTKRAIIDAGAEARVDDVTVDHAVADAFIASAVDLTTQYRRIEISLLKRPNELSGLIFAEPEAQGGAIHPRYRA